MLYSHGMMVVFFIIQLLWVNQSLYKQEAISQIHKYHKTGTVGFYVRVFVLYSYKCDVKTEDMILRTPNEHFAIASGNRYQQRFE